jgi:hypothetical protein
MRVIFGRDMSMSFQLPDCVPRICQRSGPSVVIVEIKITGLKNGFHVYFAISHKSLQQTAIKCMAA